MNRPDLAAVLLDHRLHASMNICTCRSWRATPNAGSLRDQHEAHLAAVLNAAVDAWLADEKTRETVARAILADDVNRGYAADEWDDGADQTWLLSNATAALAALTQREDTP
jgi:hypothetical protein